MSLFLDFGKYITRDQYTLQLLQHGLRLSFDSRPLFTTSPVPFPLPMASSQREHLRGKILAMLNKGAIERVMNTISPEFCSLLFVILIPERTGNFGWSLTLHR